MPLLDDVDGQVVVVFGSCLQTGEASKQVRAKLQQARNDNRDSSDLNR